MGEAYAIVALGAALAGFIQGLSGFGFGMVAMSVWAWTLDPRLASSLAVFGALTGQIIAALSVRRGFDLKRLAPFILGGLLGIPLGVWLLPRLDTDWFKAVLGGLLALWCPIMLLSRQLPRIQAGGRIADGLVGISGGMMGGLGGITGALPSLWCTLRGYEKDTQRAIIQNFNLSMLTVTMATYLASGIVTRPMLPFFAIVLPAMLIPTFLGTRVYFNISDRRFQQIVLGLLALSGAALLASALPRLVAG